MSSLGPLLLSCLKLRFLADDLGCDFEVNVWMLMRPHLQCLYPAPDCTKDVGEQSYHMKHLVSKVRRHNYRKKCRDRVSPLCGRTSSRLTRKRHATTPLFENRAHHMATQLPVEHAWI